MKLNNISLVLITFVILTMTGCSTNSIQNEKKYTCEFEGYVATLTDNNKLSFQYTLRDDTDDAIFLIDPNYNFIKLIDDVELSENQFIVYLERVGENLPKNDLYAITEEDFPYFKPLYGSKVIPKVSTGSENVFYSFVMPCYLK